MITGDQHLWVADGVTNKFLEYDLNGKLLYSWGTYGTFPGAFWGVHGLGLLLQDLKNSGVVIGVLIHDILPITVSEYFQARDRRVFVKGIVEVLTARYFGTPYGNASVFALLLLVLLVRPQGIFGRPRERVV